jgi:hypothetical protein
MRKVLSFGRAQRGAMSLAATAELITTELIPLHRRCTVEILACGNADDHADWISIAIRGRSHQEAERCAEQFSKQITRYGGVVLLSGVEPVLKQQVPTS